MRIAYITAAYPYINGEQFLEAEIEELSRQGHHLVIAPARPRTRAALQRIPEHSQLIADTSAWQNLAATFAWVLTDPRSVAEVLAIIMQSPRHLIKNLAIIPRAINLSRNPSLRGVDHIHAHWLSTSSTAALIISIVLRVPYSITVHRWDIVDGNLASQKAESATLLRFISESSRSLWPRHVPLSEAEVIPMGVKVPSSKGIGVEESQAIVVPGSLTRVKGHTYLLEALSILAKRGLRLDVDFAGDGELKNELEDEIKRRNLQSSVNMVGVLPHSELLERYKRGRYGIVVLPSIDLGGGHHEGLPVALIEAMSYGLACISTKTGGIPELITDGHDGLLVCASDPRELADAIQSIVKNTPARRNLGDNARETIAARFAIEKNTARLIKSATRVP